MDIDYVEITRKEFSDLFSVSHPVKAKDLSMEDIDQWCDVYLISDGKVLRHDTVEVSDETGEDVTYHHYYYKGLIR